MKSRLWIRWIEIFLAIGLLAFIYLPGIGSVEFETDESQWISTSNMLESYVGLKFDSPIWDISYWNLTQPPVPRYLIGIGRLIGGYHEENLNTAWHYGKSPEFNRSHGAIPSDGLLWWSRLPMTMLGMASILAGFLFLRRVHPAMGYAWLGLMALNPYFLVQFRSAMGESPLIFFSAVTLYFLTRAIETTEISDPVQARKRAFLWLGLAGITSGLAWASKLNGVTLLGAGVIVAFIIGNRLNAAPTDKVTYRYLLALVAVGTCVVTFLAVNPFLWHSTLLRIYMMFGNRAFEMNLQAIQFPESNMDLRRRFSIIPLRVFHDYAGLKVSAWINMTLTLAGILIALVSRRNTLTYRTVNLQLSALLLVSFFTASPVWLSQKDWARYYIYPVFFSTMFSAVAIGWLVHKFLEQVKTYGKQKLPQ
jgi:4-amino-4-deoxy-L-arabinose transferase-like glycosyltransferase